MTGRTSVRRHITCASRRIGFGSCITIILGATASLATAGDGLPPVQFSEVAEPLNAAYESDPSDNLAFSLVDVSNMMGAAVAGDFNRDGRQDLYILGGGDQPDRFLLGTATAFVDRTEFAGLDAKHIGIGACVGDYDNDGWLDIFVISFGEAERAGQPIEDRHRLWRNNGDNTFTDMADEAGLRTLDWWVPAGWGPAFGDYDLDGDLDLAIPSWTGGGTRLMRNDGDGTFTDVSAAAGVLQSGVQGFSARFVDIDGDRYPELLVAGDFGTSRYFVNNRDGTFSDETVSSGTGLDGNGMGHAVADFDRDGRLDWYVTSIYGAATPSIPGDGNYFYRNTGDHTYEVPAFAAGTIDGGWGWGTEAVDIDHDGWVDIVETNGWPMENINGELEWVGEACYVYRNDRGTNFADIAATCGLDWGGQGRGLLRLDLDNDGDQDFVVLGFKERVHVYRNDLIASPDRAYLRLTFDTSAHPRLAPDGYGTRVVARTDGVEWIGVLTGGSTFASQSELSVHFGFGSVSVLEELRIEWADGSVTRMTDVPTSQLMEIESGFSSDLTGDGTVGFMDLLTVLARYGSSDAAADLDADGQVAMPDLAILIGNWTH